MWFVLLGAAAALAFWGLRSWPTAHGPFDGVPPEAGAKIGATDVTIPASGRSYLVTAYTPTVHNMQFHVAEQKALPNWIRYWVHTTSGVRTLHSAYAGGSPDGASDEQILLGLRKDFIA